MGRGALVVVMLAGCGRIGFGAHLVDGDGGGSGSGDGGIDTTCWPAWKDGSVRLSTPRVLSELGAQNIQRGDPSPTFDALTLYYVEGAANPEILYATRADRQAMWTTRGAVTELSAPGIDVKLTLSGDELVGVYSSDRGGADVQLYGVSRAATTAMFDAPVVLANVNTQLDDYDPHLTPNGLDLYFAPNVGGGQAIQLASRPTVTAPFVVVRMLSEIAQVGTYSDPSVSPDELVIAYAGLANAQLFYAVRSDTSSDFGAPLLVPDVNGGTGRQTDAELTSDGCELYFSSTRNGTKQPFVSTVL